MDQDKHIGRIKKLLALSKSANVHEAALAMEHAQRLMTEHNLSMTDVQASDVNAHTGPMAKAKTPARHMQFLSNMVADAFGCHVFITAKAVGWSSWESTVSFVGIDSAAELAGYAFDVLRRQLEKDRREHIATLKRCKPATKTRRADAFCEAWVWQVSKKVRKLAIHKEQEAAIATWKEREELNLKEGRTRKSKELKAHETGSVAAGAAKGRDAQLHAGVNGDERLRLA